MSRGKWLWLGVFLYAAGIFALSSISNPPSDGDLGLNIPFLDSIAHFFIYLFFGVLLYLAFEESGVAGSTTTAYLAGTLYAFSDEVHQHFVPMRSCDPMDFLADAVGIFMGIAFLYILRRKSHINEDDNDEACQSRTT